MRRILFIIGTLDSGGVAKSIVNLLNAIDREKQEVHLLVMSAGDGPFAQYIPEEVIIHRNPITAWLLAGFGGVWQLLKHGHLLLALGSLLRMALSKIDKPSAAWLLAQMFPELPVSSFKVAPVSSPKPRTAKNCNLQPETADSLKPATTDPLQPETSEALKPETLSSSSLWDVIVDYNGQQDLYYMVDKLKGKKKFTFFHSDYHKWPFYERMDRKYFPQVDAICTISEQCVHSLKEVFPEVSDKVKLVPNISLPSMIYKLAEEKVEMPSLHGTVLVTVGHVCYNKGIDLIIGAAKIVKQQGLDFSWILVGSTDGAEEYLKEIHNSELNDNIYSVGVQPNPYAFMKRSDIVVHPSRFEGKSITLDEAKILCKPIVVTNYSTVGDQFENGVNASVCEMNSNALADAIKVLLENDLISERYYKNLKIASQLMESVSAKVDRLFA